MNHLCGVPRQRGRAQAAVARGWFAAGALACAAGAGACIPTAAKGTAGGTTQVVEAVNCADAERGLEFGPFTIADFEQSRADPDGGAAPNYYAQFLYSYFDGTSKIGNPGYQPSAELGNRCGNPSNHVFHMTGGPFLGWGGGMGIAMQHFADTLCPSIDITNPNRPSYCAPASVANNNQVAFAAMNLSEWDGVAVWARRGPTSQPLLRVLVGNKDTDDDIAYLMYDLNAPKKPLYCQRVRDCSCLVNDQAVSPEHACTYYDTPPADSPFVVASPFIPGYYCGRPGSTPAAFNTGKNYCNTTACDAEYPAYPGPPDYQFYKKPCSPFTYRSGTQTSLCYDPATETPAETDQQCGDHFTFPLTLTTEWKLYLVPFNTMYQQGFGKRAETMDLTSVSVVRLTWDAGVIDYYIDDLRFYRLKRD